MTGVLITLKGWSEPGDTGPGFTDTCYVAALPMEGDVLWHKGKRYIVDGREMHTSTGQGSLAVTVNVGWPL